MSIRIVSAVGVTALLLAGCGVPAGEVGGTQAAFDDSPSPTVADVDYGPFLLDDPLDGVASLTWLDVDAALAEGPIREDGVVAVLMGDSTPDVLHIAVNGGGCRPEVYVSVLTEPPDLELEIAVGDPIAPPGLQCSAILTTHGFEVVLNKPVSLDNVVLGPLPPEDEPEAPVVSDGDLRVIVRPGVDGGLPPDVIVSCRAGPSFPASELENVPPVEDVELPGLGDAMQSFLGGGEGQSWPQDGWRVLYVAEETVMIVHHDPATAGISFMDFELQDGSWRWAGASSGGPCSLQTTLPEGLGVVEWTIDPNGPDLTPETTSIPVLVTELDCTGGRPMGDRLLGPEVVMTDTQVLISFAAQPLSGAQECPGNPEQPVTVELAGPLGDREVIDGLATGLDLADFLE